MYKAILVVKAEIPVGFPIAVLEALWMRVFYRGTDLVYRTVCGTVTDKALMYSKGHPPSKSLLYFLESACKKRNVLKTQDSKWGICLPDV